MCRYLLWSARRIGCERGHGDALSRAGAPALPGQKHRHVAEVHLMSCDTQNPPAGGLGVNVTTAGGRRQVAVGSWLLAFRLYGLSRCTTPSHLTPARFRTEGERRCCTRLFCHRKTCKAPIVADALALIASGAMGEDA